MNSRRVFHEAPVGTAAVLVMAILTFLLAPTSSVAAPASVLGTIVSVSSDSRSFLLRLEPEEPGPGLRRFETRDSTRIQVNGGPARFADILVGGMARVLYVRLSETNVAELVELVDVPPASSSVFAARDATGLESRKRYLEDVDSTLDVLEESVQELARHSELEGTEELIRRRATIEELQRMLAKSRELLASLSVASSLEAWRRGVDEIDAALGNLRAAHARGSSEITNR